MDVVADAGAIRRWIISAKNLAVLRLAERNFEHVRNEVRFDAMILTELSTRASGVEITERNEFEPVNLLIPVQHFFEHEL